MPRSWPSRVYGFFRSLKLAVVVILILVAVSIVATLIPQGREPAFYTEEYGALFSWIVTNTGFDRVFRSVAFLVPMALFFVNLAVCTYDRMVSRAKKGLKNRFGPDILHIGILLLIVAGIVVALTTEEGRVSMAVGDEVDLPGGYVLRLQSFVFLTYDDGRPRDWISTVEVRKGPEIVEESYAIEVNRPLDVGGTRIYQFSHDTDAGLIISDPEGREFRVRVGQSVPGDQGSLTFKEVQPGDSPTAPLRGVFAAGSEGSATETVVIGVGENIGVYLVEDVFIQDATGLRMKRGSGRGLVLAALLIIVFGVTLTYVQKIGDNQL